MLQIVVHKFHPGSRHVASVPCVSKLNLNFSMLQTLIFDVADVESRCCTRVMLGVANIKFQMDVEF
jgi:hypothetical protein